MLPMPARLVWSSSASRSGRSGSPVEVGGRASARPSRGRAGRGRGGRRRRPRPRGRAARRCRARSRPRWPRPSRGRPGRCAPGAASAGRGVSTCQVPSIFRWVCSVHRSGPRSMRVSRCLPRETVSTTVPPREVGGGELGHPEVGRGRARCPLRRAVEQPGGAVDGVALRHAASAPAASRRSRRRRAPRAAGSSRRPASCCAVGPLDGEPAQRAASGGLGQRLRRPGRARSASSLQVSRVRPPRST